MVGNNELILNEATMIEAVQFWLNAQMVKAPTVTGVSLAEKNYSVKQFSVAVEAEASDG